MPFPRTTPFHWYIADYVTLSVIFTGCQAFLRKKLALGEIKQEIASSSRHGVSPSFPPLSEIRLRRGLEGLREGGGKMTVTFIWVIGLYYSGF